MTELSTKCLICHEVIVHRRGDPVMHVGCSIADDTDEAVRIYGERHPAVREAAEALRVALLAADPYAYTPGTPDVTLDEAWAEVEAALPEGWNLTLYSHRLTGTYVAYVSKETGLPVQDASHGPTPAAALHALAVALQSQEAGE